MESFRVVIPLLGGSLRYSAPVRRSWLILLLTVACDARGTNPAPAASTKEDKPSPRQLGQQVVAAVAAGDPGPIVALLPKTGADVSVEIKQALVETDERTAETLRSPADVAAWLARSRPKWTCAGDGCPWPRGIRTGELGRCLGDCCFSDWPGGIEQDTLYVRRVCVAAREGGEPRLSYIGFVEAK